MIFDIDAFQAGLTGSLLATSFGVVCGLIILGVVWGIYSIFHVFNTVTR